MWDSNTSHLLGHLLCYSLTRGWQVKSTAVYLSVSSKKLYGYGTVQLYVYMHYGVCSPLGVWSNLPLQGFWCAVLSLLDNSTDTAWCTIFARLCTSYASLA